MENKVILASNQSFGLIGMFVDLIHLYLIFVRNRIFHTQKDMGNVG